MNPSRTFKISMPTPDVPAFLEACERAEWSAFDTGERVMTEDGPDGESLLLVEPLAVARAPLAAGIAQ